ncbi:bifunctional DNA primase/polymerase [Streptomyces sp. NPDC003710]
MSAWPPADVPEYVADTGAPGIPNMLTDDARHQFVPINAEKASAISWGGGVPCLTWQELMDGWFGPRAQPWWDDGYRHIGVRLELSGLVVIDADVVMASTDMRGDDMVHHGPAMYHDGRGELGRWLAAMGIKLPPTLTVKSAGREDGTHLPGWQLYYRQNPGWYVRPGQLTPHVEVKANGICRYTDKFEILRDELIAELPLEVAKALASVSQVPRRGSRVSGSGAGGRGLADLQVAGENDALIRLKGFMVGTGIWTEEQANEVLKFADSVLDDPMGEARLRDTVLRVKGWDE